MPWRLTPARRSVLASSRMSLRGAWQVNEVPDLAAERQAVDGLGLAAAAAEECRAERVRVAHGREPEVKRLASGVTCSSQRRCTDWSSNTPHDAAGTTARSRTVVDPRDLVDLEGGSPQAGLRQASTPLSLTKMMGGVGQNPQPRTHQDPTALHGLPLSP